MKIAMMGQTYPPRVSGAALFTQHLAEALVGRGHKVLVLTASERGEMYLQQIGNLSILRLPSCTTKGRVPQHFLLWPAKEVRTALQDFRPHVIHLHEPVQLAIFARRYSKRANIPTVLTIHALPNLVSAMAGKRHRIKHLIETILWKYAALTCRKFDVNVTPTETTARMVAEKIGNHAQVVSGGVDMQIFHPNSPQADEKCRIREEFGIPAGAKIILHTGRLDAGKNACTVVRAAGLAMQALSPMDVHLLVAGDGCEKPRLEILAREMGIAERCHFPGIVSDQNKLAAIYRTADLFCTASEIETQGLVLLEAAACGLPLVACDATSIHEIVKNGINGSLVALSDPGSMAGQMTAILKNPDLRKEMGKASIQASLAHDFRSTVSAYESIYLSAIQMREAHQAMGVSAINHPTAIRGGNPL